MVVNAVEYNSFHSRGSVRLMDASCQAKPVPVILKNRSTLNRVFVFTRQLAVFQTVVLLTLN